MRDILLIYNPKAGDTSFRFSLDRFIEVFSVGQWEIRVFRCSNAGSAAAYLLETDLGQTEAIFVAGGTGTMDEVVGAMILRGAQIPLGIIPAGTENEVAKRLGFGKDLEENLEALSHFNRIRVDVGQVGDRFFIDQLSLGTVVALSHASSEMKNTFGMLANYMMSLTAIHKFRKMKLKILSGTEEYEGTFTNVAVINTGLRKNVYNSSGEFTLVASKKASYSGDQRLLKDRKDRYGQIRKNVLRLQGDSFDIIPLSENKTIMTETDGDIGPMLPVHIQIHHKAIEFFYNPEGLNKGKKKQAPPIPYSETVPAGSFETVPTERPEIALTERSEYALPEHPETSPAAYPIDKTFDFHKEEAQ